MPGYEKLGRQFDRDRCARAVKKHQRDNVADVRPLILKDDFVKAKAAFAHAVLRAQPDDAEIVDKERPDHHGEDRVEHEPQERLADVPEREHFNQGAGEIKEVVDEFERPPDEGERVNRSPGPEEQDNEKGSSDVRPRRDRTVRHDFAGVLRQESERDALDDAGQRQLDIYNDLIQLASWGGRRFHGPSRTRFGAPMSMARTAFGRNRYFPNEFCRNLTRDSGDKTDSRQGPR